MEPVVLAYTSDDNIYYEAKFLPDRGMNLISYKRNAIEIIDQSTLSAFQERSAGLGPLIGPHFHRRKMLPKIENEPEFPQKAYCRAHHIEDLFSHGVARYVPWKCEKTETGLKAELTGKDEWYGVPLAAIEGQNFKMIMEASLNREGLKIILSVASDTDSVVGLHYYYRLPNGKGIIKAQVKNRCIVEGQLIPASYELNHILKEAVDTTYFPGPDPLKGKIILETDEYVLETCYECQAQENSWQLYHPKDASYVCIEPISAQDPRHPNLSVSSLCINLRIDLSD